MALKGAQRQFFTHAVRVTVEVEVKENGAWGSGIIIAKDGTILTALHAVEGADAATVRMYRLVAKKRWETKRVASRLADVLLIDREADLAVLKMRKPPADLTAAVLGTSYDLKDGDPAFRVGRSTADKLAGGHIIKAHAIEPDSKMPEFWISMPSDGATSGGPVFDPDGRVIGIALRGDDDSRLPPVQVALPIDVAKSRILWRWLQLRDETIPKTNPLLRAAKKG